MPATQGSDGSPAIDGSEVRSAWPAEAIETRFISSASFDDIGVVVGTSSGLILSHTPSPSLSTTSGWVVSSRTSSSTCAGSTSEIGMMSAPPDAGELPRSSTRARTS